MCGNHRFARLFQLLHIDPLSQLQQDGIVISRLAVPAHGFDVNAHLRRRKGILRFLLPVLCKTNLLALLRDPPGRLRPIDHLAGDGQLRTGRCQLHDPDTVAAQAEKVIVDPDLFQPQCFLKCTAQHGLNFIFRRNIFRPFRKKIRLRQVLPVNFTVGIQRHLIQMHIERRDHIGGQLLTELLTDKGLLQLLTGIIG